MRRKPGGLVPNEKVILEFLGDPEVDGGVHGYRLQQLLDAAGIELAGSVVYARLRKLESLGYLVRRWELPDSGPPRRLFSLTDAGRVAVESLDDNVLSQGA